MCLNFEYFRTQGGHLIHVNKAKNSNFAKKTIAHNRVLEYLFIFNVSLSRSQRQYRLATLQFLVARLQRSKGTIHFKHIFIVLSSTAHSVIKKWASEGARKRKTEMLTLKPTNE